MIQYVARFGMNWVAQVDAPWFVAGVLGAGVPTGLAAGSVITDDGKAFSLVSETCIQAFFVPAFAVTSVVHITQTPR